MKQFYQRILLFSAVILFSLFNLRAQTVTNSYVYTYDSVYTESYGVATNYSSSGSYTFTATAGKYKLEVWGAQGGTGGDGTYDTQGGRGGYSVGVLSISSSTQLYVYCGGAGSNKISNGGGGFNGGGNAGTSSSSVKGCPTD